MFSVDDNNFAFFLWLYNSKKLNQLYRSSLERTALKYGIENPETFANKKQLLEMILNVWLDKFRQDPEFHKAYEKRWDFTFSTELLE